MMKKHRRTLYNSYASTTIVTSTISLGTVTTAQPGSRTATAYRMMKMMMMFFLFFINLRHFMRVQMRRFISRFVFSCYGHRADDNMTGTETYCSAAQMHLLSALKA